MDSNSDDDYHETSSEDQSSSSPIARGKHGASPIQGSMPIRRKRRVEESSIAPSAGPPPPLKRTKGHINLAYLELLNRDISDACSGLIRGEDSERRTADMQLGAVLWSAAEQDAFFTAVGRLGRRDQAGIAARIRTKSVPEVCQFLALLDAAEVKGKWRGARRNPLRPVDVPAAVEIGAECDAALEAAADVLSLHQESYEEQVEKERWGLRWRVTAPLAESLGTPQGRRNRGSLMPRPHTRKRSRRKEQRQEGGDSGEQSQAEDTTFERQGRGNTDEPFFHLFCIPNWLRLSARIFMNSSIPDNNWRQMSEDHERPAIQMTALSDFYALAVSVTRRLLFAAMYVAESRIRKNSFELVQRHRKLVLKVEDVLAAVSSLGMRQNSDRFWAQCARRLQLHVEDDGAEEDTLTDTEQEEPRTHNVTEMSQSHPLQSTVESESQNTEMSVQDGEESEDDDNDFMGYDEIEAALGHAIIEDMHSRLSTPECDASTATDTFSSSEEETHDEEQFQNQHPERDEVGEHAGDIEIEHQNRVLDVGINSKALALDAEEAMVSLTSTEHTVVGADATRAIMSQIRVEHGLEQEAELLDAQSSVDAETHLLAMLRGNCGAQNR
ncbi:hypothetical protein F4808DRAFT_406872 [Astrocystis sublimbata]|nr:hypothetical protein F4808DRAFT_406872 [Astrocystis sublimbata]